MWKKLCFYILFVVFHFFLPFMFFPYSRYFCIFSVLQCLCSSWNDTWSEVYVINMKMLCCFCVFLCFLFVQCLWVMIESYLFVVFHFFLPFLFFPYSRYSCNFSVLQCLCSSWNDTWKEVYVINMKMLCCFCFFV